jgi:hypothetical protein
MTNWKGCIPKRPRCNLRYFSACEWSNWGKVPKSRSGYSLSWSGFRSGHVAVAGVISLHLTFSLMLMQNLYCLWNNCKCHPHKTLQGRWHGRRGAALCMLNLGAGRAWVVNTTCQNRFAPREWFPAPVLLDAGWAPGPVWTGVEEDKFFAFTPQRVAIPTALSWSVVR